MEEIKVSIIVPSYKRSGEFFARAIKSLLAQTYENIEIVVVDDNAKLEHADFRKELENYIYMLNNKKITYVQNSENLGGAISRNVGIEKSSGEYITFLDDDDRYLPDKVMKQLAFMTKNQLDMSFTDLAIYNEQEVIIDYRNHSNLKNYKKSTLKKYHLIHQITGTPTFMVKKKILLDVGCFEPSIMGQEYYLMSKIIDADIKIGYANICDIVAYRTKAEAISTGPNKIIGENALYKFKKQNFSSLNLWERSYVRCRHYAVMAVAYKRNKMYFKALYSLILSCMCNPIIVLRECVSYVMRVTKKR